MSAFAAARREDYSVARARFAEARDEAARLPKSTEAEKPKFELSRAPKPSLEEEAAYQHAVLAGKVGDPSGAEAALLAFIRKYPHSPLIHSALKRIANAHGGDVPPDVESAWRQAMELQAEAAAAEARRRSRCGPECLVELLRRAGRPVPVEELVEEMGTDGDGTTLKALAAAAERRGLRPKGQELAPAALREQQLPLIALLDPGHYVIVDKVYGLGVQVWDPDGQGVGKPSRKTYRLGEWEQAWHGVVLTLVRSPARARAPGTNPALERR